MMKAFLFTFRMAAILTCHQASAQLLRISKVWLTGVALLAAGAVPAIADTIATYDFAGNSPAATVGAFPGVTASDMSISSALSPNASFNNNRLEINRPGNKTFDANRYTSFTLQANPGELLDLDFMSLDTQTTGQGFRTGQFHVRSDFDGFLADLGVVPADTGSLTTHIVDLSTLDEVASIEFRVFPVETNPSFAGDFAFDNLVVDGQQIQPSNVVPEPSTLAIWSLLAVMALAYPALRLRRK